jgi:DNA-3-methyladenine glycosylase
VVQGDPSPAKPGIPSREWFARHPVLVAPELLGAVLTSTVDGSPVSIRITEVEAYGGVGEDPGSHAYRRRTPRNAAMFGPPGCAYVYFTYGMHWCLNVVAHEEGSAGAVLVRAGEVVDGLGRARERRPAARADRDLARGPARLAAALGVTRELDGADLLDPGGILRIELRLARPATAHAGGVAGAAWPSGADDRAGALPGGSSGTPTPDGTQTGAGDAPGVGHHTGPRTGLMGHGSDTPWRFWIPGDPTVSPHRAGTRT